MCKRLTVTFDHVISDAFNIDRVPAHVQQPLNPPKKTSLRGLLVEENVRNWSWKELSSWIVGCGLLSSVEYSFACHSEIVISIIA